MDKQRQDDQLEPTYNSSVVIQDIALKISWEGWMIGTGGERESRRSMLAEGQDDDLVRIYSNSVVGQEFFLDVELLNWYQRDA